MVEEYISILHKYQNIYGDKIALLYQCGSFMELYALKSPSGELVENPELETITNICGLALVEKKQVLGKNAVVMAGVRDYILEKYLTMLSEAGYTSIVFVQERQGAKFVRKLECIVSCGTHITFETDTSTQHSNYLMCIWVEKIKLLREIKPQLLIGLSTTNVFTGKTYFFEYNVAYQVNPNPTIFDELERQISIFSPSEIIMISNLGRDELQLVLRYSNVRCSLIHYINLEENENARNCAKQQYIEYVFTTYFKNTPNILNTCIEFQTNIIATQSFCYLLHFIHEHNPNLLKNITLPLLNNTSHRMVLGNQTLKQLNIIDDGTMNGKRAGKYSSISTFLNCTSSPMGRRLFQQHIVNPCFNVEWLQGEYNIMTYMLDEAQFPHVDDFRTLFARLKDIEKLNRQIVLQKIYPCSLYSLYESLRTITESYQWIDGVIREYSQPVELGGLVELFEGRFFIDRCKQITGINVFDENIFRGGFSAELDEVDEKYNGFVAKFNQIHQFLNYLLIQSEEGSAAGAGTTEFVKVHETEKSGASFQITKRRGMILKSILSKNTTLIAAKEADIDIDMKITTVTGSNEEIHSSQIRTLCHNILSYREKRNVLINHLYLDFLRELRETQYETIENAAGFVAKMDVLMCKCYNAKKYNYSCPVIAGGDGDGDGAASTIAARGLRHPLIEHLQTNEIYVPNDACIGNEENRGVLIYGVNTTGKTSYIRSVGIAIILAQAGMFVPCSEFVYRPYKSIFSRILGNDNLFHGLSTFAVEMSELRVILKMADENTLVIGDEICAGTETQSALSIFVTALMELDGKKCSFLFATHFHEIVKYDEIRAMNSLKIKHMSVTYDREKDVLIYERKLRDGPGHRMYGIEICKSLHLPDDFIEKAYSLRNKYYAETTGALSHKPSVYNSGKIRGMCEMCGEEMAKETHHIAQQKDANPANGYISTPDAKVFHKNHFSNLMGLCEKCHDKVHSGGEAAANENPHPADAADATDIAPPPPLKKKVVYRRKNKI
jgi:DNA mismatch repair protein MutS